MPSTFFTEPPHWRWLIILYFFFGGLAGGCYVLASMLDLMGRPSDRPLARLGCLLAFPALVVSLGSLARVWLNAWGALLVLGVVGIGIVVPLLLHAGAHTPVSPTARLAAVLVLVGGFLLRVVIVLSSEAI